MERRDIVIIGGGPAGLAAAIAAYDSGVKDILILERDKELGGILNQCIHNGFGLHTFKEELTGPEYASRFISQLRERNISFKLDTTVVDISEDKVITAISKADGLYMIQAGAVVLAMGCRERSRGALNIPGFRTSGVFSAGTAQRLINMEGFMPGKEVVILGSGDIGLIMARRMTLEGAKVKAVVEIEPHSSGLKRNIVQCLDDFGIPLLLRHTVTGIDTDEYDGRISKVVVAKVDDNRRPVDGTEMVFDCDTLLISCGLIPENELSRSMGVELSSVTGGPVVNESLETSIPGVFAAGNVLHVHDLVDYVSKEAASAGVFAAEYVKNGSVERNEVPIVTQGGPRYTVPSSLDPGLVGDQLAVRFRVGSVLQDKFVSLYLDEERVIHRKRPVMSPGEMEEVVIKKEMLNKHPGLRCVKVCVEEE